MTAFSTLEEPKARFRFSGHETFPCRYTWLPKAVQALSKNPQLFSNEDEAMVVLGVGKNMVRAIRFWAEAAEVIESPKPVSMPREVHESVQPILLERAKGQYGNRKQTNKAAPEWAVSDFGNAVFGPNGHDKFLEDINTLWLLHWKISTNALEPLFAWYYLLNFWHRSDFSQGEVLRAFASEAARFGKALSPVTLETHFTTFLHTYVPTRGKKGEVLEDNLDSPLVELELVEVVGERLARDSNRRETIYAFRLEEKEEISPELFVFCLDDFWRTRHSAEQTLPFREIAVGLGSPGQIFKLPEQAIRDRLEKLFEDSSGTFEYHESANLQQVHRAKGSAAHMLLKRIYGKG